MAEPRLPAGGPRHS